jgi:hypothetical protein
MFIFFPSPQSSSFPSSLPLARSAGSDNFICSFWMLVTLVIHANARCVQSCPNEGWSVSERAVEIWLWSWAGWWAEQNRIEHNRAEESRAEHSRAEQNRTEQSRTEQSRTEQSRRHLCSLPRSLEQSEQIQKHMTLQQRWEKCEENNFLGHKLCKVAFYTRSAQGSWRQALRKWKRSAIQQTVLLFT